MSDPHIEAKVLNSSSGLAWAELATLRSNVAQFSQKLREAESQVKLFARVNVFTDSPEEAALSNCAYGFVLVPSL